MLESVGWQEKVGHDLLDDQQPQANDGVTQTGVVP